ncbi:heme-binding protein 2-like [Babylonia areolata]|uniref:heme-binding protein 2-like n=1 Tax=Babylonia areolata TaxID=304850 RepID=UPI003FD394CC
MFGLIKTMVRGLQKPEYKVVCKTERYEERCYLPAKWVSTTVKGISLEEGMSKGFRRLFRYISGENENNVKVEMTAPVTTWVEPGEGPNCESSFTVAFYIPSEHQANPPKPSSSLVFIEDRPQFSAYVTTFGGFASEKIWVQKAVELGDAIGDHSQFNDAQYFTAGYDPPFKPFGRTNEVWFVKRDLVVPGSSVDRVEQRSA